MRGTLTIAAAVAAVLTIGADLAGSPAVFLAKPLAMVLLLGATLGAAPAPSARYRGLIAEAFKSHPRIDFKVDPALIAGLEVHGPHFVVNNSWRADLTKIVADLTHDNQR